MGGVRPNPFAPRVGAIRPDHGVPQERLLPERRLAGRAARSDPARDPARPEELRPLVPRRRSASPTGSTSLLFLVLHPFFPDRIPWHLPLITGGMSLVQFASAFVGNTDSLQ